MEIVPVEEAFKEREMQQNISGRQKSLPNKVLTKTTNRNQDKKMLNHCKIYTCKDLRDQKMRSAKITTEKQNENTPSQGRI